MGADQDAVEVGNVRGYRNAKMVDADAAKPAFSPDQRRNCRRTDTTYGRGKSREAMAAMSGRVSTHITAAQALDRVRTGRAFTSPRPSTAALSSGVVRSFTVRKQAIRANNPGTHRWRDNVAVDHKPACVLQQNDRLQHDRRTTMETQRVMFSRFAQMLRSMSDEQLSEEIENPKRLLLSSGTAGNRRIDIVYAPFDDADPDARIVLVGLTPGRQQMGNALREARRGLQAGLNEAESLAAAESFASFSGPMRTYLVAMLDSIGVNQLLGVRSTALLWDDDTSLVHFTSVCRNPVFVDGRNYSGAPPVLSTPILREQVENSFVPEVASLRRSIFVPLGTQVSEVVEFATAEAGLDQSRVLAGLPHPSGANAERIAFFLGRKPREMLSSKVNPDRLIAARAELKKKVTRLKGKSVGP